MSSNLVDIKAWRTSLDAAQQAGPSDQDPESKANMIEYLEHLIDQVRKDQVPSFMMVEIQEATGEFTPLIFGCTDLTLLQLMGMFQVLTKDLVEFAF